MQVLTCYWHTCACFASYMLWSGSVTWGTNGDRAEIYPKSGRVNNRLSSHSPAVHPIAYAHTHAHTSTHKHTPYPSPQSCRDWTESPRPPLSTSFLLCFWPSVLLSVRWPSSSPSESEGEKKNTRKRRNEHWKGPKNGQIDLFVSSRTTHSPGLFISFFKI